MARDIYLVTHCQSEHHVQGLVGGWYDTGLTDLGRRQAMAVADHLAGLVTAPVEILSSDLKRAAHTAGIIAGRFDVPVRHTPELRERGYGVAEGRAHAWLWDRLDPPPRHGDRLDHRDGIDGAESKREFMTRLSRALDGALASACETQIIVTHGFALTFLIAAWIGMPVDSVGFVNFASGPGGVTHLREDDVFFNRAVLRLNDRAHLAGVV